MPEEGGILMSASIPTVYKLLQPIFLANTFA